MYTKNSQEEVSNRKLINAISDYEDGDKDGNNYISCHDQNYLDGTDNCYK